MQSLCSDFQKTKRCVFGLKNMAKPFRIQGIWKCHNCFLISKTFMSAYFFAHFWRRLTMFGGEVSNLPKASASEAEDKCGDYAVYMKA